MRSPLMELLREKSAQRVTLDDWLSASGCENDFDGEIEVPEEFEDEYRERCRLNAELERKWHRRCTADARCTECARSEGADCTGDCAERSEEGGRCSGTNRRND